MTQLRLTQHACIRMAQRGISNRDIELIELIGTEVDDGYLVYNKDCQAALRPLKELINIIQRLKGKRLVIIDGRLVTAYHADKTRW